MFASTALSSIRTYSHNECLLYKYVDITSWTTRRKCARCEILLMMRASLTLHAPDVEQKKGAPPSDSVLTHQTTSCVVYAYSQSRYISRSMMILWVCGRLERGRKEQRTPPHDQKYSIGKKQHSKESQMGITVVSIYPTCFIRVLYCLQK